MAVPAVSSCLMVLKKRSDFLAAAKARRAPVAGFLLQARQRGDDSGPRVGFTCSKKVGNAVTRNRAKRRLRALAREMLPLFRSGWDYVLIGKPEATVSRDFADLRADFHAALARVHPGQA
ncbi:MAG: ribonuclease P protein component [Paracoccaceae bacterium]